MKTTYDAPTTAAGGDVVRATLGSKSNAPETGAGIPFVLGGGSGLTFGL